MAAKDGALAALLIGKKPSEDEGDAPPDSEPMGGSGHAFKAVARAFGIAATPRAEAALKAFVKSCSMMESEDDEEY